MISVQVLEPCRGCGGSGTAGWIKYRLICEECSGHGIVFRERAMMDLL